MEPASSSCVRRSCSRWRLPRRSRSAAAPRRCAISSWPSGVVAVIAAAAFARVTPAWEIAVPPPRSTRRRGSSRSVTRRRTCRSCRARSYRRRRRRRAASRPRAASGPGGSRWVARRPRRGHGAAARRSASACAEWRPRARRCPTIALLSIGCGRRGRRAAASTRPVRLLFDDAAVGTWGAVAAAHRRCPPTRVGWDDERVRAVLAHELAHVQRFDWAVQLAAEALLRGALVQPAGVDRCPPPARRRRARVRRRRARHRSRRSRLRHPPVRHRPGQARSPCSAPRWRWPARPVSKGESPPC